MSKTFNYLNKNKLKFKNKEEANTIFFYKQRKLAKQASPYIYIYIDKKKKTQGGRGEHEPNPQRGEY
jgi:hypothetical protein